MQAFVFTDPSLARLAGRFVWLALDTEKPQNAAIRKRLKIPALPTFFVLDPTDERVALRWVGGATAPQLEHILDDGARAVAGRAPGVDALLAAADSLYGAGDYAAAAERYRTALAGAPPGWPHRGRVVESLLFAWSMTDRHQECALLALAELPRMRHSTSAGNVAGIGLDEAIALPAEYPRRRGLIDTLETATREIVADTALAMAADDRSGAYISLLDARDDAGDEPGKRRVASDWATFLEGQAARARTPEERAVFDSHRLSAYLVLGEPGRAIPMLEASERDLPDDYNPPSRLAVAYKAMKRWDEALAASDRALAKAYGPRTLLVLQTRADIYAGRGDTTATRATLEQALSTAESFPPGQRSESTIAAIRKRLDALR
jgi:tetratricopeptide (TPR) repeat protein